MGPTVKLKQKKVEDNSVDFFISDILSLNNSFSFILWSFVKWGLIELLMTLLRDGGGMGRIISYSYLFFKIVLIPIEF